MSEVTLKADAVTKPIDGGIEVPSPELVGRSKRYNAWSRLKLNKLTKSILTAGAPRPSRCRTVSC